MAIALKTRREAPQPEALPAPAPMMVEKVWRVATTGMRHLEGVRLRDMTQIDVMNAQALQRHEAKNAGRAPEDRTAFVPPFTTGQAQTARAYRDLVEWREGSGIRGSDLVGRTGGAGGAGLYIDSFIDHGLWLDTLRNRIGDVVVMDVRRHMDRGNARRRIMARDVVDMAVLAGLDLSAILTRHGWTPDGKHRKALRAGLCAALDRMAGPVHTGIQVWQDEAVRSQQKGY